MNARRHCVEFTLVAKVTENIGLGVNRPGWSVGRIAGEPGGDWRRRRAKQSKQGYGPLLL